MPIYEFVCEDCDTTFEVNASFFQDLVDPECPECHSKETHKKFSFFMSSFGSSDSTGSSCGSGGGSRFT